MTLNDYLTFNMGICSTDTVIIWDSVKDYERATSNWRGWTVEEIPEKLLRRKIAGFSVSFTFRDSHVILE